jgi:methylthioribose-1-phosphate isomerase
MPAPVPTRFATIAWRDGAVTFLDQTLLPEKTVEITTQDPLVIVDAIRKLRIRGAPAIGVAAAYGVALAAQTAADDRLLRDRVRKTIEEFQRTRPTAVNLFYALDRMQRVVERVDDGSLSDALLHEATVIDREDVEACERIGEHGARLLAPGSAVLTHCNAGALATAGIGTALGIITTAHRQGKITKVFVDETRPLLQGARLTAWELLAAGIETVLITDSTAGSVLARGMVQAVIVGADRIAANGDTANKVGTYPLAVLACRHGVPFYVAAPWSTIDPGIPTGEGIPIEERDPSEVTAFWGTPVAPKGVRVYSPAFDVTPNKLISAIVTEKGVATPPFLQSLSDLRGRHD